MSFRLPCTHLAVIIAVAAWAGPLGAATAEPGGPARLEVAEPEADIGAWLCYRELSHEFRFRNTGDSPLEVKVLKQSCGCTGTLVSPEPIAPNAEGYLRVSHTPNPKKPRIGPQTFTMTLGTNDPNRAEVLFVLKVRLVEPVDVAPSVLDFGRVKPSSGEAKVQFSVMSYADPEPSEIRSVEAGDPTLTVRPLGQEAKEEGTEYRYALLLDTAKLSGDLQSRVVVETGSGRVPVVEVPVKASVPLPLQARPARVLFGTVRETTPQDKSVTLMGAEGDATPRQAECTDPRITAAIRASDVKGQWNLDVKLNPAGAPLPSDKRETIRTNVVVRGEDGSLLGRVPVHAILSTQGR